MADREILLVEDNPDDVELTLRSFKANNICNKVVIAQDGARALGFSFQHRRIFREQQQTAPARAVWTLTCRRYRAWTC